MENSISVLMSIYYKENPDYFHQAMESIWDKQTLKPYEIVLVEDGKLTKDLYDVINIWKNKLDEKLKIIPLIQNGGLSKALNVGIEQCKGEFIARMDTDDISAPNRFEKQIEFFEKNPDVHIVGGSIQEFDDKNPKKTIRKYPQNNEQVKKYIVKASPLAHPSVMFRKIIFCSGIRYSEKYKTSQDIELWFRLLKFNYKIANIKDVIYFFRQSKDFYKRRSKTKAINEFKIYWHGILELHGYTWKLIYPVLRLTFRCAPQIFVKKAYSGALRKFINIH